MPTTNEVLSDLQIQHAFALLKFGNGVERDILKLLSSVEADILERVGGKLATMPKPPGYPYDTATEARLVKLLGEVRQVSDGVYSKGYEELADTLGDLATVEADHQAASLDKALPVNYKATLPQPQLLKAIATVRPFEGFLLKDHFEGMAQGRMGRIEQAIRTGMVEGQGAEKIVSRIAGDQGFEVSRRSARGIVRTSINHVANQAAQETWKENKRLIKGWQFISTLDSRTTLICAGLDGQVFPIGEGPVPPRHRSCRSISVAVTKSFEELGNKDRKDYKPDTRASIDGQVAASHTFESWLKGKPEEFQRSFLGPARHDLWKSGNFDLREFVKDGREVINLDQLKATAPKAPKAPKAPAEPKPEPKTPKFTSPYEGAPQAGDIKVRPKTQVKKELSEQAVTNNRDFRYMARPEFKDRKTGDFGSVTFAPEMTPEATSMIGAIMPELDKLSDAFSVPRIRGIKETKGAVANMGDGTLGLNPDWFNRWAREVGGNAPSLEEATAALDAVRVRVKAAIAAGDTKAYKKARKDFDSAYRQANFKEQPVSQWKIGDKATERPGNAFEYFPEGVDRARQTLYHEMAHQVHQMNGKTDLRAFKTPPIEAKLRELYRDVRLRGEEFPSNYATSNCFEWFAESFSLYMMGRKDLVMKEIKDLIEGLLGE